MDKLTLIAIAASTPAAVILDDDGDVWHADCLMAWIDQRPDMQKELSYLTKAHVVERYIGMCWNPTCVRRHA